MRHFLKVALILISVILSGCSGKASDSNAIPFFYDSNFAKIAEFSPVLFTGDEKTPLFQELDKVSQNAGITIRRIEINDMEDGFLSVIQDALPADVNKPVIVISHLYAYADVVKLLADRNVSVVGPSLDIDTNTVKIVGNGFDIVREEGMSAASSWNKITYIMPDNKFQKMISDAFIEGAGEKSVSVFSVNMEAVDLNSQALVSVSDINGLVVAVYGRYFKKIFSPKTKTGMIRIINYPGKPEFMESWANKKTEKVLYYDFMQSFKTALSNIEEKGVFYSFELIRQ